MTDKIISKILEISKALNYPGDNPENLNDSNCTLWIRSPQAYQNLILFGSESFPHSHQVIPNDLSAIYIVPVNSNTAFQMIFQTLKVNPNNHSFTGVAELDIIISRDKLHQNLDWTLNCGITVEDDSGRDWLSLVD